MFQYTSPIPNLRPPNIHIFLHPFCQLHTKLLHQCIAMHNVYIVQFLDTQVSLAPTHVSWSVSWFVSHTFGFPISSRHTTSALLLHYFCTLRRLCARLWRLCGGLRRLCTRLRRLCAILWRLCAGLRS